MLNLSGIDLYLLRELFFNRYINNRIQRIKQPDSGVIYLKLFPLNIYVIVSVIPGITGVFESKTSESSDRNPMAFQMLLRKYIMGGRILDIQQHRLDRTLIIKIGARDVYHLILRLYGTAEGNIILCDRGFVILGDIYGHEPLKGIYRFPDDGRLNPFNGLAVDVNIMREYEGLSRKNIGLLRDVGDFDTFLEKRRGELAKLYPGYNFIALRNNLRLMGLKKGAIDIVNSRIMAIEGRLRRLRDALDRCGMFDEIQKRASLLYTVRDPYERCECVTVRDYSGNPVQINLSRRYTIIENAERLFRKAKKLKKDYNRINSEIEALMVELAGLKQALNQLEDCNDPFGIEAILFRVQGDRGDGGKKIVDRPEQRNRVYHKFISPNGHVVLVSRNMGASEVLTFRIANKWDLFFHVDGFTGAHVILRCPGHGGVDDVDIHFAARKAKEFSHVDPRARVSVVYTRVGNIRKIPGKYTGRVILRSKKSIIV